MKIFLLKSYHTKLNFSANLTSAENKAKIWYEKIMLKIKKRVIYWILRQYYTISIVCLGAKCMEYYGTGCCDNGYYAGWDEKGDKSEEDCEKLCLKESQCTFAAYYKRNQTCNRYNETMCRAKSASEDPLIPKYKTYKKVSCYKKGGKKSIYLVGYSLLQRLDISGRKQCPW